MSIDIKEQVIREIKDAGLFALQLDESTDVSSYSLHLIPNLYLLDTFMRENLEKFLFCQPLETTTKGEDIMKEALASRTLPRELQAILDNAVKRVNYVRSMPVNTRLFKQLCKDLDSEHQLLLFYTKVRWLSKGNVLNRVFELTEELKMFLDMQDKEPIFFNDPLWEPRLAYLADMFDQLNKLNLKLQGKDTTGIPFVDTACYCCQDKELV
ncbi:zinc finger BED domain-containing protein 5-like [Macrobrachium nipponense]|uniref:zinc finger BED domain-containing protein 5-like n=1 Tax=Macrobrachium nipponense TaxID=159736 RepID=UPI0030C8B33F